MEVQLLGLDHSISTVAVATVIFLACLLFPKISYYTQLHRLPAFGSGSSEHRRNRYLKQAKNMYQDGYRKVSFMTWHCMFFC